MKTHRIVFLLFLLGLLASGCNLPGAPAADTAKVSAWIDKPLHESTHLFGPIEVLGHGAAYEGVQQLELSFQTAANGPRTLIGTSPPTVSNTKPGGSAKTEAVLAQAKWVWTPPTIGTFTLQLRAQKTGGAWSDYGIAKIEVLFPEFESGGVILPDPGQGPQPVGTPTPTATITPTPAQACTNAAKFIADITIPDNTNLPAGASFTKTWRLQNSGTCTWDENYKVVFVSGNPMSNPTPWSVPGIVAPGATVDISLGLVAPTSSGSHTSSYQLRSPQNEHFGVGSSGQTPIYVQIVVGSPTAPPATAAPTSGPDNQPPSVSASHNPPGAALPVGSIITFTANASDNVGVTRIDIWVTAPGQFPTMVKSCNNSTSCSFAGGPYNTQGNLSYFANARDAAGNETNSSGHIINLYFVVQ